VPLASPDVWEVRPALGTLAPVARLVELASSATGGGVLPAAGAADEGVAALAKTVEVGPGGGELCGRVGWGVAFERVEFGEQPGAVGGGVVRHGLDGGVDADRGGGAGDPVLVAVERPVVGDVVDGLVEVVGDGVHGAGTAGAGHGDVGELATAALCQVVRLVGGGTLLAMHGQRIAVVEVLGVEPLAPHGDLSAVVGRHRQALGAVVDGDDAAALAGD
jgi:hypothetical protein